MDIVIRNARRNEASELSGLAMRSKAYWGYSREFMDACREELSVPQGHLENDRFCYVVAEHHGVIVGYYALERLSAAEFELEALFVEPRHIGSGIGRALITHAKKRAETAGGHTLVIQGDPNAENFYRAAGGKLTGRRESASIPGRFLPIFEICLAGDPVMCKMLPESTPPR